MAGMSVGMPSPSFLVEAGFGVGIGGERRRERSGVPAEEDGAPVDLETVGGR